MVDAGHCAPQPRRDRWNRPAPLCGPSRIRFWMQSVRGRCEVDQVTRAITAFRSLAEPGSKGFSYLRATSSPSRSPRCFFSAGPCCCSLA